MRPSCFSLLQMERCQFSDSWGKRDTTLANTISQHALRLGAHTRVTSRFLKKRPKHTSGVGPTSLTAYDPPLPHTHTHFYSTPTTFSYLPLLPPLPPHLPFLPSLACQCGLPWLTDNKRHKNPLIPPPLHPLPPHTQPTPTPTSSSFSLR